MLIIQSHIQSNRNQCPFEAIGNVQFLYLEHNSRHASKTTQILYFALIQIGKHIFKILSIRDFRY